MNKKENITYIGIDQSHNTTKPLKNISENNINSKFILNKHNYKIDKLISKSKGIRLSKKCIISILLILSIIIFKPIKFLKNTLEQKRAYYEMSNEYNSNFSNISFNLKNLWDDFIFATGEKYYIKCKGTMIMPVDGTITCHYDFSHMGIDIQSNRSPANIHAAAGGIVSYIGSSKKYGNELIIKHYINGMTLYTYYGNLSNIYVKVGDYVDSSTIIANDSAYPENTIININGSNYHVHFAVRKNMKESSGLNPLIFVKYR